MERSEPTRMVNILTRKKNSKTVQIPALPNIQWLPLIIGFFMARALLLDELLPFGIAYLAAVQKCPRLRTVWPFLGVLVGYATLAPYSVLYPYYFTAVLIWLAGYRVRKLSTHRYWLFWITFCIFLAKIPLLASHVTVMTWINMVSETAIALAGYCFFSSLVDRDRVYALSNLQFQLTILLVTSLLGVDLVISGISVRIVIMFYLVLATARSSGVKLAVVVGPIMALIALLLQLPLGLVTLIVVVPLLSGLLYRIPGGILLGGILGFFLTFGLPATAATIPYLFAILAAALLVYLTPTKYLRQLERVIPGTKGHNQQQKAHVAKTQAVLSHRTEQFSRILSELAVALEDNGFIAQQLTCFSEIVQQLGIELETQVTFAEVIEEKLWRDLGCPELNQLTVVQTRTGLNICGNRNSLCGEYWCKHVVDECESVLDGHFQVVNRNCHSLGRCGFDIRPKARYVLDVKIAQVAQNGVSGDSQTVFNLSESRTALLLSDGMGTGSRASSDSMATINLLEQMISTGYEPELAVRIINQTLLARNARESFATIDLVVADLCTGQLDMIKIGAAASFIKRGNNIEVIQNHSLPIGILNHVEVEPEKRLLCEGDYLIMVTDGILDVQREVTNKEEWLSNLLRRCDLALSCQELAETILAQSHDVAVVQGQVCDDMMVLVAKLVLSDPEIYPYRRKN